MKRTVFVVLTAMLAVGLLFTGCPTDSGDSGPKYGTNLITEAAILAATGDGLTSVVKVSTGKYTVTGTTVLHEFWAGEGLPPNEIPAILLTIPADPDDLTAYFSQANRYRITIDFPNSSVKPLDNYIDGFNIYLENIKGTDNTGAWAGTWQHEFQDEYDAIGGVGTMSINRDLTKDGDGDPAGSEVGDYQHLVVVLKFDDADLGEDYTFTISNVGVYGAGIEYFQVETGPQTPVISDTSILNDAIYETGDTADNLTVTAGWQDPDNRWSFTYEWFVNSTASTGGTLVTTSGAIPSISCTPSTATAGTFYYYAVISFPDDDTSATSRFVKIIVRDALFTEADLTPIDAEKYRIQSWYDTITGEGKNFMRDEGNGILELGEAWESGTDAWNWIVMENPDGQRAIKNAETGNFINVKGLTPGWDVNVLCSPFEDDPGFYWDFDVVDPDGGLGAYHLFSRGVPISHQTGGDIASFIYQVQWRNDMPFAIEQNWGSFIFAFWPFE